MSELRDPRVLFAAERTLLAWARTSVALIGFGFLIERFRLFEHLVLNGGEDPRRQAASFYIGLALIALGGLFSLTSALQYRRVVRELNADEIPRGYWVNQASWLGLGIAVTGLLLVGLLAIGGP